jgi:hypothetical protein
MTHGISTQGLSAAPGFRGLGRRKHATLPQHVAGKSLFAISAGGMIGTLAVLCAGRPLSAAAVLLLTLLVLEIMLQRAVTRFHMSRASLAAPSFPSLTHETVAGG